MPRLERLDEGACDLQNRTWVVAMVHFGRWCWEECRKIRTEGDQKAFLDIVREATGQAYLRLGPGGYDEARYMLDEMVAESRQP